MTRYLFFDVETSRGNDGICQIGFVSTDDFKKKREGCILVNPGMPIHWGTKKIHGITDEDVASAPLFSEAWDEICDEFEDAIIVGHSVKNADLSALRKDLLRYGKALPDISFIDTKDISYNLGLDSLGLETLCEHYGVDLSNHHNALADAHACYEILQSTAFDSNVEIPSPQKYDGEKYTLRSQHSCGRVRRVPPSELYDDVDISFLGKRFILWPAPIFCTNQNVSF